MYENKVLEGHRIIHHAKRSWGEGTIVEEDNQYIKVVFDSDEKAKPRKFEKTKIDCDMLKIIRTEDEKEELYEYVVSTMKKHGSEGFVHYTAYENLKSILKDGYIYSRDEMINSRHKLFDVAEEKVLRDTPDKVKSKVRLMYGFNTPISYHFEKRALHRKTEMVAIVINPKIILDCDVEFYEKSAARENYGNPSNGIESVKDFNWNEIFERGRITNDEGNKDCKIKYRDAEAVVIGALPIKYITAIYFRSEKILEKARNDIGNINIFRLGDTKEKKHFSPGVWL